MSAVDLEVKKYPILLQNAQATRYIKLKLQLSPMGKKVLEYMDVLMTEMLAKSIKGSVNANFPAFTLIPLYSHKEM